MAVLLLFLLVIEAVEVSIPSCDGAERDRYGTRSRRVSARAVTHDTQLS
jgi:hypothetical protein